MSWASLYPLFTFWIFRAVVEAQYRGFEIAPDLSPRFYLGNSPLPQLDRRQSGLCASNSHSCLDINASVCCPDTQYCIVNGTFSPQCCDIGSTCGNPCDDSHYVCVSSTTISGTATATAACCPRSCPSVSQFKCASSYGGGCCPFGYACESGNSCIATAAPTMSDAAVVSEIPGGCTTNQIACPSTMGGGCCGLGLSCTVLDNTNYCASASSSAVQTGLASGISEYSQSSGISTGAKAGIGAGVALGACVALGALLWFCIVHRRRARDGHESSPPVLSEETGEKSTGRPSVGRRLTSDYFGPIASRGPFSADGWSPGSSPGGQRGVPLSPDSPVDIAASVEIGSSRDHSNVTSPGYIDEYMRGPRVTTYSVEVP